MTTRIALILFATIAAAVALDLWQGWGATLFLLREAYVFLDWVIFWR